MHQVLAGIKHAVDAWSCNQNLMTTVTKLTTERFDHIDRLLNLHVTRISHAPDRRSSLCCVQYLEHLLSSPGTPVGLALHIQGQKQPVW